MLVLFLWQTFFSFGVLNRMANLLAFKLQCKGDCISYNQLTPMKVETSRKSCTWSRLEGICRNIWGFSAQSENWDYEGFSRLRTLLWDWIVVSVAPKSNDRRKRPVMEQWLITQLLTHSTWTNHCVDSSFSMWSVWSNVNLREFSDGSVKQCR